ncbi:adenylate/guanylate cyclase domain-containing protein [Oligoflexaceae bacterium]|nr:adenylate/guanylate cyclase domain-containing protein [Oligoflexaceae bacterium]
MVNRGLSGAENRSKLFFGTGHVLAVAVVVLFCVVYFGTLVGTKMWRQLIFDPLPSLSKSCEVKKGSSAKFEKVELPFGPLDLKKVGGKNSKMEFRCKVEAPKQEGLVIAHWGWLKGGTVQAKLNGNIVASFSGLEKISFPVRDGDVFDFYFTKNSTHKPNSVIGFVGMQPPVLTTSTAEHLLVAGVEILLRLSRVLNNILPFLSLGLVCSFAWFSGHRSRTLTMALYLLVWLVISKASSTFQFFSTNKSDGYLLLTLTKLGYDLSVVLFTMEYLRVLPKIIYPIARIKTFILAGLSIIFISGVELVYFKASMRHSPLILSALFGAIAAAAFFTQNNNSTSNILKKMCLVIVSFVYLLEYYLLRESIYLNLSAYLDFITPCAISFMLLHEFSNSENKFVNEKKNSASLSMQVKEEASRRNVLSRFLPSSLVMRFSDHEEIENQLSSILKPRESNVAVIQADLRGFSQLSDSTDPKELVDLLQKCFTPTVEKFQNLAMIKLIGDCFFAFVERPQGEQTQTDICIDMALSLVEDVGDLNRDRKEGDHLNFGIGINYGKAFVGNLSSSECIDYTVIGDSVNIAARLEELSKQPKIQEMVGNNGIILGVDAIANLKKYSDVKWSPLLISGGLRSYDKIVTAAFIQKDNYGHIIRGPENRRPAA